MSIKYKGQTMSGPPGKDATINGENAVEIVAGENVSIDQQDGTLTISATGGGASGDTTLPVKAPIGCIVWWSGTADNIPTGWHICDGTSGTIDLRDKFILAAGTGHSVGETGGSEEVTLTVAQMPKHNHYIYGRNNTTGFGINVAASANAYGDFVENKYTLDTGDSQPHPNMPPYYTLCAIQKISADETDYPEYEAGTGVTFTTTDSGTVKIGVDCPIVPITSAAYEALTETEKNANVAYLIVDVDE